MNFSNMAANLNPPSHFVSSSQPCTNLLPPSTFEKPKVEDPWKSLGQATSEILTLRQQNQQLSAPRNLTVPIGEEIKARVNVHHTPSASPFGISSQNIMPFETMIQRQAEEIMALKKQISHMENISQKQITRLESQLLIKDSEYAQKVTSLCSELKTLQDKYEFDKETFEATITKFKRDNETIETNLKLEIKTLENQRQMEISALNASLHEAQSLAFEKQEDFNKQKEMLETTAENQKRELQQMRSYLQESEKSFKSSDIWRRDICNLQKKVTDAEDEIVHLKSELELSNVRLKSLSEILAIQEQDISAPEQESLQGKRQCLLTRWRSKVFELMLQVKSLDLSLKDSDRQWSTKLQKCQGELSRANSECGKLQHSLQEKQAHLDMEQQAVKKLQKQVQQADEVALKLDAERKQTEAHVFELAKYANDVHTKYCDIEKEMKNMYTCLNAYNQRISFASGRVEMLQSQFARREALLKVHTQEVISETPMHKEEEEEGPEREIGVDISRESYQQLLKELEQVTLERDQLASQIKTDSEMMEEKMNAVKMLTKNEVTELKERLKELHEACEDKTEECANVSHDLERTNADLHKCRSELESLEHDLKEVHTKAEIEMETVKADFQNKLVETIAEMEHRINDAHREHTKDIIKIRQMERQSARDKERTTKHLEMMEKHFQGQCSKLDKKLKSTEIDRNILLNTVRQEGLITKYKQQRQRPAEYEEESDTTTEVNQGTKTTIPAYEDSQTSEPLHEVIDDLKKLTAVVLDDDIEN